MITERCGHMSHHGRCVLSPGHDDSIDHLYPVPATPVPEPDTTAQQLTPPAEDIAQNIRNALRFNADTASPALATVRDLILTLPGSTPATALASARVVLAAHTRELAALVNAEIRADRARRPGAQPRSAYAHRGGMMSARQRLDRYADDLDAAADGA